MLLDATSGNTGIAYAMIGAIMGIKVLLAMPENISLERRRILEAYGAELILTSSREGADGAIRMARKLYAESPETYFYPDQYSNPANWQAHYKFTAHGNLSADGRTNHSSCCGDGYQWDFYRMRKTSQRIEFSGSLG